MNKRIKIQGVADFSSIKREVNSISRTIDTAFGDGLEIFDRDALDVLKREINSTFVKLRSELTKLTKEGKELQRQFHLATGDAKKQEEISKKQLDNAKKRVEAEKELFRLKQAQTTIETGLTPQQRKALEERARRQEAREERQQEFEDNQKSKRRLRVVSHIGHIGARATSRLPAIGEAAEVGSGAISAANVARGAGLGTTAMVGLGLLAGAAVAAAVAISRMSAGFEVYKQSVGDLLKLTGMGVRDLAHSPRAVEEARQLGFDKTQLLQFQGEMVGAFGSGGRVSDTNRMLGALTAARGLGLDPAEIFGGANQLRAVGGTDAALKQMSAILEKAFTSGMDKTQASHYLNAAVGLLSEINQTGVGNVGAMLDVLSGLVAKRDMSPEQAARTLSGMSGAIAESSGEANAFFQMAAARAGFGRGTLLGAEFATRQGLVGVDLGALEKQIGDTRAGRESLRTIRAMGLGDVNFTQKFASAILGEIRRLFPGGTTQSNAAALGFTGTMFGTKSAPEQARILALLEKLESGKSLTKDEQKFLEDVGKDPQSVWRTDVLSHLDQVARNTAATAAGLKNAQFDLGEASSGIFNTLTDGLTALNQTITELLNFLKDPLGIKDFFGLKDEPPKLRMVKPGDEGFEDFRRTADLAAKDLEWVKKKFFGEDGQQDSAPSATSATAQPAASGVPVGSDPQMEEQTNELKKQTQILERLLRPGEPPRVTRGLSRP